MGDGLETLDLTVFQGPEKCHVPIPRRFGDKKCRGKTLHRDKLGYGLETLPFFMETKSASTSDFSPAVEHGVCRWITDPGSGSVSSIGISPGSEGSGVPSPSREPPRGGGTPDPGGEGRIGYETVRRTRDPGSRDKAGSDRWTPCVEPSRYSCRV